jgi:hypothetical protein
MEKHMTNIKHSGVATRTALGAYLITTTMWLCGCAAHFDVAQHPSLKAPRASTLMLLDSKKSEGFSAEDMVNIAPSLQNGDIVEEVNEACTRKRLDIKTRQAAAADRTTKAKLVSGLITGGVGALGGGATAGVAQASPNGATGSGIATAVLAIVGGIVTAVIAPGDAVITQQNATLDAIDNATMKYNAACASNPTAPGCSALLGAARGLCEAAPAPEP